MTKVFLGAVCLGLLLIVLYQGRVIAEQQALIHEMTRNPQCLVPGGH